MAKTFQRHALWVSILLHFLLLASSSWVWVGANKHEPTPNLEIPSYVYHDQVETTPPKPVMAEKPLPKEKDKIALEKPVTPKVKSAPSQPVNISKETEPVHLVGDSNIDQPLLTLLGKALAKRLVYPKIAVDFHLQGVVLVGFTLYPDGKITGLKMVKTSQAGVLDQAAFEAVKAMTPGSVSEFIKQPKYMVVGIIFGGWNRQQPYT